MAIVKGPLHSERASGNLGSLCYSEYRGRSVVRSSWTGTYPNTTDQQTVNNRMAYLIARWGNDLTAEQRQSWEDLASSLRFPDRFGERKQLSGYNLYLKRNLIRMRFYTSAIDVPIEGGELYYADETVVEFQGSYPRVWLTFHEGVATKNADVLDWWRAGPYDTESRSPIAGEWKSLIYAKPPGSSYDTTIVLSKWYWYRGRAVWASGVANPWSVGQVYTG